MNKKKLPKERAPHKSPPKAPSERDRLAFEKLLGLLPDRGKDAVSQVESVLAAKRAVAEPLPARIRGVGGRQLLLALEVMRLGDNELDRKVIDVIDVALRARREPGREIDLDKMIGKIDQLGFRRERFYALVHERLSAVDANNRPLHEAVLGPWAHEIDEAFATFDRDRERELVAKHREAKAQDDRAGSKAFSIQRLAATLACEASVLGYAADDLESAVGDFKTIRREHRKTQK